MRKIITVLCLFCCIFLATGCEPATITPSCPDSCDDQNKCTADTCSELTNYTCKHDIILNCLGNNICEQGEESTDDCSDIKTEAALTINSVEYANSYESEYYEQQFAKTSKVFLIVDATISNKNYTFADKDRLYLHYSYWHVTDENAYQHSAINPGDIFPFFGPNTYILKGDKQRGQVIFEVPVNTKIEKISIKTDPPLLVDISQITPLPPDTDNLNPSELKEENSPGSVIQQEIDSIPDIIIKEVDK